MADDGHSPRRLSRQISDVDRHIIEAELDAGLYGSSPAARRQSTRSRQSYLSRPSNEIERISSSISSSNNDDDIYDPVAMSRIPTQTDLERTPSDLVRIATQRSQHSETVGMGGIGRRTSTRRSRMSKPLPEFGGGKPYPPMLPSQEAYVVEFDGPADPLHAQNWPLKKKLFTTAILGYTTLSSVFASSLFSPAILAVSNEYKVGTLVGTLGITTFILGFAFGPTFWAPFSELSGRRLPIIISMFGFTVFSVCTAVAKDIQTVIIGRFFSGLFGAGPMAVVAAVFSDMFDNRTRGVAITTFSMIVFTGPMLAPFIGGYIIENPNLGWRWTEWLPAIMGGVAFILDVLFLEETYPPAILVQKASELRRRTRNWGIHAKQEEIEIDFRELISKNFSRPMRLLFFEPIVLLISIYTAFIYGLLYLFITSYPAVFQRIHGFTPGQAGLPFFGMVVGQLLAGVSVLLQQPGYQRKLAANGGIPVPEWRLPNVIAGGIAFTIGIFWFGWTGYRADIHWIVPTLSGILTGFGLLSIFLQALNYLIDAYLMFAASTIAANTFLRSIAGACFPLFADKMFTGLGVQWAATLLGCVAAVLIPIPIFFYIYGKRLRQKSKFAPVIDVARPTETDAEKGENAV